MPKEDKDLARFLAGQTDVESDSDFEDEEFEDSESEEFEDTEDTDDADDSEDDDDADDDDSESGDANTVAQLLSLVNGLREEISALKKGKDTSDEDDEYEEDEYTKSLDFVGEANVTDLLKDKNSINSLLQKVYVQAQADMLKKIPKVVNTSVSRQASIKAQRDAFYESNPDLKGKEVVVGSIATQIQNQNPDWDLAKVLKATSTKAYKILGIKKKAQSRETQRRSTGGGFAKGGKRGSGRNANAGTPGKRGGTDKSLEKFLKYNT